jgi:hypothetical protein
VNILSISYEGLYVLKKRLSISLKEAYTIPIGRATGTIVETAREIQRLDLLPKIEPFLTFFGVKA